MEANANQVGPSASGPASATSGSCTCPRCRMRGLMGPVMLITIGALFLVEQYTRFGWGELWPVILIVAGIVKLAQSIAPNASHIVR